MLCCRILPHSNHDSDDVRFYDNTCSPMIYFSLSFLLFTSSIVSLQIHLFSTTHMQFCHPTFQFKHKTFEFSSFFFFFLVLSFFFFCCIFKQQKILAGEESPRKGQQTSAPHAPLHGESKIQSFTNATRALKFIESQGISLVNCRAERM